MSDSLKAIAFDLDRASLVGLREALPGWEIEVVNGATAASVSPDWNPGAVDLLVVQARKEVAETLRLCRSLRSQADQANTSLLVLVTPSQEALVTAALKTRAHACLTLPVSAKDVANMFVHARAGTQPGRQELNLEHAQAEDRWRDDGGQE